MYSRPLSARKTREAARSAVLATNKQAHVTVTLAHTTDQHAATLARHGDLWFTRGIVGRFKFLLTGK